MRIIIFTLLAAVATAPHAGGQPLAIVGDQAITRPEVESRVKGELFEIENTRYEVLRQGLDAVVAETLLAREATARGMTVAELEKAEITAKTPEPSAQRIDELLEAGKDRLGDATPETVRPQLVAYLRAQYAQARRQAFLEELQAKYDTKILLRPPTVEVGTGSAPPRGNAQAPVTIVEFADYECPYCRRAAETIKQVLDTYGDRVKFAYRDFPLAMHPNARPAAEAAHCAGAQGKYWEYHDKLFASTDLTETQLRILADEIGLDREKFDQCLANDTFAARVDKDIADGSELGIDGTPVFFVNGRLVDGAQPFEAFQEIIDQELRWAKQGG